MASEELLKQKVKDLEIDNLKLHNEVMRLEAVKADLLRQLAEIRTPDANTGGTPLALSPALPAPPRGNGAE